MSKKNLAIIVIAVILIIIGIIILNNNKDNDNSNASSSTGQTTVVENPIIEKKTNGTYEIYNTDLNTNSGTTKIKATVKNISKSTTPEQFIDIVLLDKSGNELGTIKATVPSLDSGVATEISAESLKVYTNIYDFKIK